MKLGASASDRVPAVARGESPAAVATLSVQAAAVMKTSAARLDRVPRCASSQQPPIRGARRDQLIERMRAVFGRSFVVLPHFNCSRRRRRAKERLGCDQGRKAATRWRRTAGSRAGARARAVARLAPACAGRSARNRRAAQPERRTTAVCRR